MSGSPFTPGNIPAEPAPSVLLDSNAIPPIVVVVDGNELARRSTVGLLDRAGIRGIDFSSAEAFLASADPSKSRAGCLLLDVELPGMSGLELFRRLPALGVDAPVIFLTASNDIAAAVAALREGAFDFLVRPCPGRTIVNRVEWALAYVAARRMRAAA